MPRAFSMTRLRLLALLLPVGLSACASHYAADVRNLSASPISAQLIAHDRRDNQLVLDYQWIGPGDRKQLGPASARPRESVLLRVDAKDNPGYPGELDLDAGLTAVNVTRDGDRGRFLLREAPR